MPEIFRLVSYRLTHAIREVVHAALVFEVHDDRAPRHQIVLRERGHAAPLAIRIEVAIRLQQVHQFSLAEAEQRHVERRRCQFAHFLDQ